MTRASRHIVLTLGLALIPAAAVPHGAALAQDGGVRVDRSVLDALGPAPRPAPGPGWSEAAPQRESSKARPARRSQRRTARRAPRPQAAPAAVAATAPSPPAATLPAAATPVLPQARDEQAATQVPLGPSLLPATPRAAPEPARAAPPPPPAPPPPAPAPPMVAPPAMAQAAAQAAPPAQPAASVPPAPVAPAAASVPPAPVAPAAVAAAVPRGAAQSLRIGFSAQETELGQAARQQIIGFASTVPEDEQLRVTVNAYASGDAADPSRARRTSLSRALAVRTALMEGGVRSTRIDVRALGLASSEGPADRVDVIAGSPR